MRTILVAIDDSEASDRVAQFVNAFFGGLDVEILAVNVATRPSTWVPALAPYGAAFAWSLAQADEFEQLTKVARGQSEKTLAGSPLDEDEAIVESGDPTNIILGIAREREADLVVVGSNHKNLFERVLFGSVSHDLVREADAPVLVVP